MGCAHSESLQGTVLGRMNDPLLSVRRMVWKPAVQDFSLLEVRNVRDTTSGTIGTLMNSVLSEQRPPGSIHSPLPAALIPYSRP